MMEAGICFLALRAGTARSFDTAESAGLGQVGRERGVCQPRFCKKQATASTVQAGCLAFSSAVRYKGALQVQWVQLDQ